MTEAILNNTAQVNQSTNNTTSKMVRNYLDLVSCRHKILSQNIANVNTPGFKANEVDLPQKFGDLVNAGAARKKIGLRLTSHLHMQGTHKESHKFQSRKLNDPFEVKANGNNVSLTHQIAKISQNQTLYDTALKAYASGNSLLSTTLGK